MLPADCLFTATPNRQLFPMPSFMLFSPAALALVPIAVKECILFTSKSWAFHNSTAVCMQWHHLALIINGTFILEASTTDKPMTWTEWELLIVWLDLPRLQQLQFLKELILGDNRWIIISKRIILITLVVVHVNAILSRTVRFLLTTTAIFAAPFETAPARLPRLLLLFSLELSFDVLQRLSFNLIFQNRLSIAECIWRLTALRCATTTRWHSLLHGFDSIGNISSWQALSQLLNFLFAGTDLPHMLLIIGAHRKRLTIFISS